MSGDTYSTSGDTYNTNVYVPPPLLTPPPAAPRHVASDELVQLRRQFARPTGINAAYDTLTATHTVFLHGPPGCGRSAAARVLLCELPQDHGTYHELSPEKDDGGTPGLSADLIGDGDRMLLDLSSADETLWQAVCRDLSDFRHRLLAKDAHLCVVPPHRFDSDVPNEFSRAWIGRPSGKEAFVRHLRTHGFDDGLWAVMPEEATAYLATHPPMRDMARLAARIDEARASQRDGGFRDWLGTALARQADRTEELHRLVRDLTDGRQRALLLATALLEGARADVVHRAATALLRSASAPDDERPTLEHAGLTERLEPLRARLTPDERIRFVQPGYDTATLRHFWSDLPQLRETLWEWFHATLRSPTLDIEDHDRMVSRFTSLCLSTGDTDVIVRLIEEWTRPGAHRTSEVRAAAQSLQQAVLDEEHGRIFIRRMYDWSTHRPAEPLRDVLIEVCEKVLAVHHPDAALVRLHHLARDARDGRGPAPQGLLRFVSNDQGVLRRFLYRLATARSADHHRPDSMLFLQLPELPEHFLRTRSVREWLTTCWQRVFALWPPDTWAEPARTWLTRADRDGDERLMDATLKILVDASGARYPVVSRLYTEARRATSPELAERLLHAINQAQSAAFTARTRNPEVSPA